MDSIADKALIVSVFFALVGQDLMFAWMAAVMVVRELAVTGLRMAALETGKVISANQWGKAKMVSQSLAILAILLGFAEPGLWFMWLALILTLISGWSYLKDTPKILSAAAEQDGNL